MYEEPRDLDLARPESVLLPSSEEVEEVDSDLSYVRIAEDEAFAHG